jgi:hypothetical protein
MKICFHNRALAAIVLFAILCFPFFLSGAANGRAAVTQDLSPAILQLNAGVVERLHSENMNERISVLDELVTVRGGDVLGLLFRYDSRLPIISSSLEASSREIWRRLMRGKHQQPRGN